MGSFWGLFCGRFEVLLRPGLQLPSPEQGTKGKMKLISKFRQASRPSTPPKLGIASFAGNRFLNQLIISDCCWIPALSSKVRILPTNFVSHLSWLYGCWHVHQATCCSSSEDVNWVANILIFFTVSCTNMSCSMPCWLQTKTLSCVFVHFATLIQSVNAETCFNWCVWSPWLFCNCLSDHDREDKLHPAECNILHATTFHGHLNRLYLKACVFCTGEASLHNYPCWGLDR